LVDNAYRATSLGSFVQNASQVAASDWVALDWDPQPDLDCTVFYRKARPNESWTGYKIQGIGHDGKQESKQKVIQRVKAPRSCIITDEQVLKCEELIRVLILECRCRNCDDFGSPAR
jgi:hypothetical protein